MALTTLPDEARAEAIRWAHVFPVAYLYRLREGSFYVSATPPSMMNADLVTSFWFQPVGYLMEGNRQALPPVYRDRARAA